MRVLWGSFALFMIGCSLFGEPDLEGTRAMRGKGDTAEDDVTEGGDNNAKTDASTTQQTPSGTDAGVVDAALVDAAPVQTGPLKAFASSEIVSGALGGLAGADALCNKLAKAAALPGTYVAWISVSGTNAVDRVKSNGPWQLVNGTTVATTKADLTKGSLTSRFDKDEKGATPPAAEDRVWTATSANGTFSGPDCNGWTGGGSGLVGEAEQTNGGWTALTNEACSEVNRVYCLQQ